MQPCAAFGLISLIVGITLRVGPLFAAAEEESALAEINQRVESTETEMQRIAGRQSRLEAELKSLRQQVANLKQKESSLDHELREMLERKRALLDEINRTETEIGSVHELSLKRIRALYMLTGEAITERLLRTGRHLGRSAVFLRNVRRFDGELIGRLEVLVSQRRAQGQELEGLLSEQRSLQAELKRQTEAVQVRVQRQESVGKELRAEKWKLQEALTALRAQALRLETVVASLTGAPGAERRGRKMPGNQAAEVQPFGGEGLKLAAGTLDSPIAGKILSDFGKSRTSEFEELVLRKGIEYQSEPGSSVSAIADGKVIYHGRMPGYGTVVILNHGARTYSLYGRLGETRVQISGLVRRGEVIGLASALDERGRNFYFEIREDGKPVDPKRYLRAASVRG